ncbi:hypothetical protein LIPSTDRAFT_3216 [Lipomyces starkeyi NRRL Y-11557]|uniref:Phosphatidic acid phosphatase type 2/haloperoxidase domain-containing protein n=1 Tax=Lipomyces starkeyi NRRL Y-11557 TaxID=675824 RepID=A0A1E3Q5J7_LIPST|nr:hypothetical protein LIPSTDRAFT_3216 [Lipomyces starkeyi NRRL Y-11557]
MSTVIVTEDDDLPHVGPPNTRRPPGRPHKKRVRTEDVGIAKKRVKVTCGRCHKQLEHNASTCTEPLQEYAVAGIGGGFATIQGNQEPFSLTDVNISLPEAAKDTVSTAVLIIVSLLAPAAIVVVVSFLSVPSPRALRGAPFALIWRRKIWEWNAGWMGLGVSVAAAFMATEGFKDLIGKPRPDLLARCDPDLSKIATYAVGGLGQTLAGAPTLVTAGICRNQGYSLVNDGFASFPSGHASFSFAGLGYLTLWLCAKFTISFPYLGPLAFGDPSPAEAAAGRIGHAHRNGGVDTEHSKSTEQPTTSSSSSSLPVTSTSLRGQGAAPPVYLQVIAFVPICVAAFIASSRYFNHRHHGFDILFGAVLGSVFAYIGFHLYHLPIRRSDGWAWAARSRGHAFFRGIGYADLVATEGWASESRALPTTADNDLRRDEDIDLLSSRSGVP